MVNNTELATGDGKPSGDSITGNAGAPVVKQQLSENANETSMTRDQLREILRWWLSPLDQSANHTAAGKARRSGAAEWLTQRGVYEEWKTAVQGKRRIDLASMAKLGPPLLVSHGLGANIRQSSPPHSIVLAFNHTTMGRGNPARSVPKRASRIRWNTPKGTPWVDTLDEISR